MTPKDLLDALKAFIEAKTKDIVLPVKGDELDRPAKIYQMKLPNREAKLKQVPYILLQFITGKDDTDEAECMVRIVAVTYDDNDETGALGLLNLITRIRIELLKAGEIGQQFLLKKPLEYIIYPDSEQMNHYHAGEMVTTWELPQIEREL